MKRRILITFLFFLPIFTYTQDKKLALYFYQREGNWIKATGREKKIMGGYVGIKKLTLEDVKLGRKPAGPYNYVKMDHRGAIEIEPGIYLLNFDRLDSKWEYSNRFWVTIPVSFEFHGPLYELNNGVEWPYLHPEYLGARSPLYIYVRKLMPK